MDVDKCVTVIMSIWWLKPVSERQHEPNKTSKRNRAGSKAEWAVLWVLQKSKEQRQGWNRWFITSCILLGATDGCFFMACKLWFSNYDSINNITSKEQRELFNMLNCRMYSSFSKALKERGVTPVFQELPVSYDIRCIPAVMFTRFPCGAIKDQDILNTQTSMGFSNSLYPQILRGFPSWATGNSAQNLGGGGGEPNYWSLHRVWSRRRWDPSGGKKWTPQLIWSPIIRSVVYSHHPAPIYSPEHVYFIKFSALLPQLMLISR